jgi:hypothetical protein
MGMTCPRFVLSDSEAIFGQYLKVQFFMVGCLVLLCADFRNFYIVDAVHLDGFPICIMDSLVTLYCINIGGFYVKFAC